MTVVPVGTRRINLSRKRQLEFGRFHELTHIKSVCEARSRRNWTLSDPSGAVHDLGAKLTKAMEMDSRGLRSKIVVYIDHDRVSHSGLNWRTWPLAIDSYYLPREAIWCSSYKVDAPIICYCARQSD